MKKSFTLGTLLLGCCLAAVAQTNQTPPEASTPPTFPQDQTGQSPSNPAIPSNPSQLPPDTSASAPDYSSDSPDAARGPAITAQGCLSQASDGNFILAESSGTQFRLHGDTSLLAAFIGTEVRVDGVPMTGDASNAGSMSSSTSSDSDSPTTSGTQLTVTEIHKLSETCPESK